MKPTDRLVQNGENMLRVNRKGQFGWHGILEADCPAQRHPAIHVHQFPRRRAPGREGDVSPPRFTFFVSLICADDSVIDSPSDAFVDWSLSSLRLFTKATPVHIVAVIVLPLPGRTMKSLVIVPGCEARPQTNSFGETEQSPFTGTSAARWQMSRRRRSQMSEGACIFGVQSPERFPPEPEPPLKSYSGCCHQRERLPNLGISGNGRRISNLGIWSKNVTVFAVEVHFGARSRLTVSRRLWHCADNSALHPEYLEE